ncbi:MAG: hypothetical protein SGPRY_008813, partial [Prymnesium sp.]
RHTVQPYTSLGRSRRAMRSLCLLSLLSRVTFATAKPFLSISKPTKHGSEVAAGGAPLPGSVVGPYLLLEKVQSVPSTFAQANDLATNAMGIAEGEAYSIKQWSQLLLPDKDLLTFAVSTDLNGTRTEIPSTGALPALPSPVAAVTPPQLPQTFEEELTSSRFAYRLHRRFQRGSHGEVWRAVRRDDENGVPLVLKRLHQGPIRQHAFL